MKKLFPLVIWAITLLIAANVIHRAHFTADFSAFLPAAPTPQQQLLVDQLQNGVVSRLLLIGIEGGTAAERSKASQQLAATLRTDSAFVAINNGEPITQQRDQQFLFENRYVLSPAISAERFSVAGLRSAIGDSIDMLASPAGLAIKNWIERDPTGEMLQLLEQWNPTQAPSKHAGVWVSRDGARALLVAQTAASGADSDAQQRAIELIANTFSTLATPPHTDEKNLRVVMSGPAVFAVDARVSIRTQVEYLATLSMVFIIIFLRLLYRSWRVLLLGLLPVATAIAMGIAAVSLWFGSVHGITLGFGTTLVGEAVDYAIYFFVQAQGAGRTHWRRDFWPIIRLGVLISVCGFATLMCSGFPGLAQLGLYSIAGLSAAALTTRFVLPVLTPTTLQIPLAFGMGNKLIALLAYRHRSFPTFCTFRAFALVLAVIATAIIVTRGDGIWNESLGALSPTPAAAQALDAQLRADLGAPDLRYMLTLSGSDQESVLRGTERAAGVLQTLVDAGVIAGFDNASRYLPSRATQAMRQSALPAALTLQTDLQQALRELPLGADKLQGFIAAVSAAKQSQPLTRHDLDATSFALAVDSLFFERNGIWHALLPLRANVGADIPAAQIRAALLAAGSDDAVLVDLKKESEQLYTGYFREALHLSLLGLTAICVLIAFSLRSLPRVIAVLAPLLLAVVVVTAALVLAGQQLNLLHLIGLFLIVAVGSNYALFFARSAPQPQTLASLLAANITTVFGFGVLAFSSVPVLQAIGTTVGPGAVLALIFSALWSPPPARQHLSRPLP